MYLQVVIHIFFNILKLNKVKSILLKFADKVLSKNEMKALKGGYPYGGGGSCGNQICDTYVNSGSICSDWSPPGSPPGDCVCHTGGGCHKVIA